MKATITEVIPSATPEALFDQVATLDRYPPWMRLVHRVTPVEQDAGRLAWWVELRAKVGPFARSKQLRMVRTVFEPGRLGGLPTPCDSAFVSTVEPAEQAKRELDAANGWTHPEKSVVRFERVQDDDRDHAEWILTAEVDGAAVADGTQLTMHLEYTGDLWSAPVLGRILDDEVRRSSAALSRQFNVTNTTR